VSYDAYSTVCSCSLGGGSSQRRLASASDDEVYQFTSSATIVTSSIVRNFKSAGDLSLEKVRNNAAILAVVTVIVGLLVAGLLSFVVSEKFMRKDTEAKRKNKEMHNKKALAYWRIHDFFNALMPDEFSGRPWHKRLWTRLISEHDWLSIIQLRPMEGDYRALRWVSAMGRLLTILFVDTILASLFFADDGTCEKFIIKEDCLRTRSLDQVDTLCAWDDSEYPPTCSFNNNMGSNFFTILILTLIITTVTIPFNKMANLMIQQIRELASAVMEEPKLRTSLHLGGRRISGDSSDIGGELEEIQTLAGTLLRAARLVKMQETMDLIPSIEEAKHLLSDSCEHSQLLAEQLLGSRSKTTKKETLIPSIQHKINKVRKRAAKVQELIGGMESKTAQNIALLQSFLVESQPALERAIAHRYFFDETEASTQEMLHRWNVPYCCLVALPLYYCGLALYVFLFGVSIGPSATKLWLIGAVYSILQDIFILQPLRVWLKWIVVTAAASGRVHVLHGLLRERAKFVMVRQDGLMKQADSLIHHFNPTCRAARAFPHLAAARLLMSLNDADLPAQKYLQKKGFSIARTVSTVAFVAVIVVLFLLLLLPDILQDTLIEVTVSSGLNFGIYVFYLMSSESIAVPIVVGLVLIGLFIAREYYVEKHRQKERRSKVVAVIDLDGLVNELDEQVVARQKEKAKHIHNSFAGYMDYIRMKIHGVPEVHGIFRDKFGGNRVLPTATVAVSAAARPYSQAPVYTAAESSVSSSAQRFSQLVDFATSRADHSSLPHVGGLPRIPETDEDFFTSMELSYQPAKYLVERAREEQLGAGKYAADGASEMDQRIDLPARLKPESSAGAGSTADNNAGGRRRWGRRRSTSQELIVDPTPLLDTFTFVVPFEGDSSDSDKDVHESVNNASTADQGEGRATKEAWSLSFEPDIHESNEFGDFVNPLDDVDRHDINPQPNFDHLGDSRRQQVIE
jgi:hypothetical protein